MIGSSAMTDSLPASLTKLGATKVQNPLTLKTLIHFIHATPCAWIHFLQEKKLQSSFSMSPVAAGHHGPGRATAAFVELSGLPDHALPTQKEKPISTVCCILVTPPSANLLQPLETADHILMHSIPNLLIPKAGM